VRAVDLTVGGLVERALGALDLAPSTREHWDRIARVDILPLAHLPAAQLRFSDVRNWQRDLGKRSRWSSNRAFEVLRRAYRWAVREERLLSENPCEGISKLFDEPPNDRVLSADELRRLLGAVHRLREEFGPYADATLLLLLTLVRRSSVLGMRHEELQDLDGNDARWAVPSERSKSGRPHVVPLTAAARSVVRRRLEVVESDLGPGRSFLFPAGGKASGADQPMTWSSGWMLALREEMRPVNDDYTPGPRDARWSVHTFRASGSTHLIEDLGVSRHVVSLLLGHTMPGPAATRVYDRSELLPERRAALTRWADWLGRLSGDTRGDTHGSADPN
jgi:integrase